MKPGGPLSSRARGVWDLRYDALTLVGAAALAYGASLIYAPLGWLVAGMELAAWGLVGAWLLARERKTG